MDSPSSRTEELVAAAVAGELTAQEGAELAAILRTDPGIADEIAALRALATDIGGAGLHWIDTPPRPALRERIEALPGLADAPSDARPPVRTRRSAGSSRLGRSRGPGGRNRRRRWTLPATAAACLAAGIAVGFVLPGVLTAPREGAPGTLGAIERLDVRGDLPGAEIDADLVAHTWGTEAVLEATGLPAGETYSIVIVGTEGAEFSAGELLGSTVPIHCRVNAAVLREDASRLEIRDAEANLVASADLPAVSS